MRAAGGHVCGGVSVPDLDSPEHCLHREAAPWGSWLLLRQFRRLHVHLSHWRQQGLPKNE